MNIKSKAGMSLIEVIVAFAIIAVVSAVVIVGFGLAGNISAKTAQSQDSAESAEGLVAGDTAPIEGTLSGSLDIGLGTNIPVQAESYTVDGKTYTVLKGGKKIEAAKKWQYSIGDYGGTSGPLGDGLKDITSDNGAPAADSKVTPPFPGNYLIEVWGAKGGDALNEGVLVSTGGKGAYASGVVKLNGTETLYLTIGGKGAFDPVETGTQTANGGAANGQGGNGRSSARVNTYNNYQYLCAGGGGFSDVRVGSATDTTKRIIVAGGGGGAAASFRCQYNAAYQLVWTLSASNAGNAGAVGTTSTTTPQGQGPAAGTATAYGSGGGGGFYGGNYTENGIGNGGSNSVAGITGYIPLWSTQANGNAAMPDPMQTEVTGKFTETAWDSATPITGPTMIGNERGGFIRITYLGNP